MPQDAQDSGGLGGVFAFVAIAGIGLSLLEMQPHPTSTSTEVSATSSPQVYLQGLQQSQSSNGLAVSTSANAPYQIGTLEGLPQWYVPAGITAGDLGIVWNESGPKQTFEPWVCFGVAVPVTRTSLRGPFEIQDGWIVVQRLPEDFPKTLILFKVQQGAITCMSTLIQP